MGRIVGKSVLLTGASEGIGRATAEALAAKGANLFLTARSAQKLEELVQQLDQYPGEHAVFVADMARPDERERLVEAALERFGRIDVLINNAGVGLDAPAEETTLEEARYLFEVNFFAPLHLTQLALPSMRAQGSGQIIQVSSIVGMRATPHIALYSASKYALNGLADAMRMELLGSNIQMTSIYPGVTDTGFTANQLRSSRKSPRVPIAVPAERVAQVIVSAIEKRSRSRYVAWSDLALVSLARILPGLAEFVLATAFRRRRRLGR